MVAELSAAPISRDSNPRSAQLDSTGSTALRTKRELHRSKRRSLIPTLVPNGRTGINAEVAEDAARAPRFALRPQPNGIRTVTVTVTVTVTQDGPRSTVHGEIRRDARLGKPWSHALDGYGIGSQILVCVIRDP